MLSIVTTYCISSFLPRVACFTESRGFLSGLTMTSGDGTGGGWEMESPGRYKKT